jgi:hypothetical protein
MVLPVNEWEMIVGVRNWDSLTILSFLEGGILTTSLFNPIEGLLIVQSTSRLGTTFSKEK